MHTTVRRDAGNPETGSLLEGDALRQRHSLLDGYDGVFGSRAEGPVRLRAVTPDALAHPVSRDTLANEIDVARTVAMRDHTRVRHAIAEGVLPLLDVAWIDARRYHPYTPFPATGSGIGHLADLQYLPRGSLLFVPRCAHLEPHCRGTPPGLSPRVPVVLFMLIGHRCRAS